MNISRLLKTAVIICGLVIFATFANAQPGNANTVDCDRGDSLNDAVNRQVGHVGPITIHVTGTCTENVLISRDDVAINGDGTVNGQITVDNARRVTISGITITGPGLGVDNFGGEVHLVNVVVTANQGVAGIASNHNGFVQIVDSTISNNAEFGILALQDSSVEIRNSEILNHPKNGVQVNTNSHAEVEVGTVISGNSHGIHLFLHSTAYIFGAEITGNTNVGILISTDSGAFAVNDVIVSGNGIYGVHCEDTESSFAGDPIADPLNCTGFNQVASP